MKKMFYILVIMIICSGCQAPSISLDGSTSMEKLVNALKESVVEVYPDVRLAPQFTGSSTGIQSLINGNIDIANSSRSLKEDELSQGLVENIVAIDGIAIIVDQQNPITSLSSQQLKDIYKGKIKNWKELGGNDQNIVVIGREAGSGTRGAFEEILDIENQCLYANELNETGAVLAKVSQTPGAIGYVSFDVVDENNDVIKTVSLDGVVVSKENITNNTYTLSRPFIMVTKGPINKQDTDIQKLFDFIYSEQGQQIIENVGLVGTK